MCGQVLWLSGKSCSVWLSGMEQQPRLQGPSFQDCVKVQIKHFPTFPFPRKKEVTPGALA